jgi:putative addiction module component (TIGR02574 family)
MALGLSVGASARVSFAGNQPSGVRMSSQLEAVEAQALKLTAEERAKLADRLIASLFQDQQIEEAWAVEVERRIEKIESGRSKLIPAAEAIARARAAIK